MLLELQDTAISVEMSSIFRKYFLDLCSLEKNVCFVHVFWDFKPRDQSPVSVGNPKCSFGSIRGGLIREHKVCLEPNRTLCSL